MKKLVQIKGKAVLVEEPAPVVSPGMILVRSRFSALSPGTEGERLRLGGNPVALARSRPDLVRMLLNFAKRRGISEAIKLATERLSEPYPLGYSLSGQVIEVGEGVLGFNEGDRVSCSGAEFAFHAEIVSVPELMSARVPEGVGDLAAAFGTLGAIAFWATKRAGVSAGERVLVIGLGILGNLAAQIARASGANVFGLERNPFRLRKALELGIKASDSEPPGDYDVVIVAAADPEGSLGEVAGRSARPGGRVLFLGPWKKPIPYWDFYSKEITILSSRSYGPGRYDPTYELLGLDYPEELSRWTIKRCLEAFLGFLERKTVEVEPLVTHRFPIERGPEAYSLLLSGEDFLGIALEYPSEKPSEGAILLKIPKPKAKGLKIGLIGAGRFATSTLIPAIKSSGLAELVWVADQVNPGHVARRHGFAKASPDPTSLMNDPDLDAVFIATPHSSHARLAVEALSAGKAVFVEKPLVITREELESLRGVLSNTGGFLTVDFGRRFSRMARLLKEHIAGRGPYQVNIRVNAGPVPSNHWLNLPTEGGRILGEACHFVDLARFLIGSRITGVEPVYQKTDNALFCLCFEDGSGAAIAYFTEGPQSLPKERIEVMGRGVAGIIEDFTELILFSERGARRFRAKQDKGTSEIVRVFLENLKEGGEPPIPIEELLEVSDATLKAGRI
ncbi:MAG: bi-domain-containing oxidoreductase [candidate division WOR-3 bacterium]